MKGRLAACALAAYALVLAGCISRETAPATAPSTVASIAAPTTVPATTVPATTVPATTVPATTVPPPTVPPTTVPPTTVPPPTPAEAAQAEITATLAALNADVDTCFAAPDSCDIDAMLNRYFDPGDPVVPPILRVVWERLKANNMIKISVNRIERSVISVTADAEGASGTSYQCEVDNSINIAKDTPADASTTVPSQAQTGYVRIYYQWQRQPDGTWRIFQSELGTGASPAVEVGELPSLTESEVAACF